MALLRTALQLNGSEENPRLNNQIQQLIIRTQDKSLSPLGVIGTMECLVQFYKEDQLNQLFELSKVELKLFKILRSVFSERFFLRRPAEQLKHEEEVRYAALFARVISIIMQLVSKNIKFCKGQCMHEALNFFMDLQDLYTRIAKKLGKAKSLQPKLLSLFGAYEGFLKKPISYLTEIQKAKDLNSKYQKFLRTR